MSSDSQSADSQTDPKLSIGQGKVDAASEATAFSNSPLSDTASLHVAPTAEEPAQTSDLQLADSEQTGDFKYDPESTAIFASSGLPLPKSKSRVDIPGYKILGELGRGAMGVVYKAHQTRADRIVALKVMLHSDHAGGKELARFQIEAQSAARLLHPNIVQIYDVNQVGVTPYFTLEFVEGGTLARKMARQMLTTEESAQLMLTLCKAMAYAHTKGVIHRDLKPANILMANNVTPKIADFGLARKTDDVSHLTLDGTVLGTPNYMSPEQAFGKQAEIGPLSDVYTLGAILYEMLIGRPPFKGASAWEVIQQVRTADPTPPSTLQPGIPRDLETICLKCLQKEPDKRYGSAQLLADDLQRFLNNEPILARPVGSLERLVRLCRRYPREARLVGFIASLLIVMAVGASITAFQISQQRDQIKTQLEVIAAEKGISDQRLVTYRDTVSQLANRAPDLLDDAPLGAGTRQEFLRLIGEILDHTEENAAAIGPSLQWGKEAIALRQGDLWLTQAVAELGRSDKLEAGQDKIQKADDQFAEAVRLAKAVYEEKPTEKSKAAANYASAVSRRATCALVIGKPLNEIVPMHKLAIDLRKEALAAAMEGAKLEEIAIRKMELGGVMFRYAEFLLMKQATDPVKFATRAKENAVAAVDYLRQAIQELPVSAKNRPRARQDLALTLKTLAVAASQLGTDEVARVAYSESVSVLSELCQEFPNYYSYRSLLVSAANAYGDYLFSNNADPSLVEHQYLIALSQLKNTLNAPEFKDLQHGTNGLAMQFYRAGLIALRAGDPSKAKSAFERCALLREIAWNDVLHDGGASANPDLAISQRIELMLALARCGRTDDALVHVKWLDERARKLHRESNGTDSRVGGLLPNQLFAFLGSAEGIIAEFLPEEDKQAALACAVMSIQRAIKTGYNDVSYLRNDPDVTPLQKVEAFQILLESSFGNSSPNP